MTDKKRIKFGVLFYVFVGFLITNIMTYIPFRFEKENYLLVFIVFEMLAASRAINYSYGLFASIASAMVFNFFYIPPVYTLRIFDPNDILLLAFFIFTSMIACTLSQTKQKQLQRFGDLYEFSRRLLHISGTQNIIEECKRQIQEMTGLTADVDLSRNKAAFGEFEIAGTQGILGILEIKTNQVLTAGQSIIIQSISSQLGNALEREYNYKQEENYLIEIEKQKTLNNMLSSISHDLRTPLTGIAGASQFLEQHDELPSLDRKKLLKDINDQANWLTQLTENILNMSKIETGNLRLNKNLEVVDDLVYEAVGHVVDISQREVSYDFPNELVMINVDGKMIIQVLVNIINNAVKYTKENDSIHISVKAYQDEVTFTISDTGTGIAKGYEDVLFDEFVTSAGIKNDSNKGIGLGLAICKAIVVEHGGHIECRNNPDKGASFSFSIPLEKEMMTND